MVPSNAARSYGVDRSCGMRCRGAESVGSRISSERGTGEVDLSHLPDVG